MVFILLRVWKCKTLLVMRLTLLICLFFAFQSIAIETFSQNKRLSINQKNIRIEDIIQLIENKTDYYFMYSAKTIDVQRTVDIEATDKLIPEILSDIFKGTNISYKIDGRLIALSKNGEESAAGQQPHSVSGKVVDSSGASLPGVSVVVKGTTTGVITDMNGKYTLAKVPENATLQFSFVGMKTQEVTVGEKISINITLIEEAVGIEEVVAVGYGTMKKGNLTGSIASIKSEDLVTAPVTSTSNALAGRLPGLVSLQSIGQPGDDAASLNIRGFGNALVLVDGIESNFNSLDADEIQSISILKDGSASIYGSRAGNGVILVTTKRGDNEKPTITFKSSYTLQGITDMPRTSSSGQYSEMVREAWVNAGSTGAEPFTPAEIQKFYNGSDPQYPNTNWYNELIRPWAPQQQHNISVRGGSDRVKYYGFLGYLDQETIWKKSGGNYGRYNLQSNLDAKILDNLTLQLDIASTIEVRKFPWRPMDEGSSTSWDDFWKTVPTYPASLPDPSKISFAEGGGTGGAHIVTNRNIAGYNDTNNQNIKGSIALNYNFKGIKGLSVKGFLNYSQDYISNKNFQIPVNFYSYDYASDKYTLRGSLSNNGLTIKKNQNRMITEQFSLNYDNSIGENHHLTGLLLYETINYYSDWINASRKNFLTYAIDQMFAGSSVGMTNDGSASEMGRKSAIGRLNYSYKKKYLIETILRADASAKFPAEKRWGYFPSVSLGWRLSEEGFMNGLGIIDELKLRASYGSSGNDGVGNFQYLAGYRLGGIWDGGTYLFGTSTAQGMISTGLANPNLTWEEMKIYNAGIDYSLMKRKIYGEFDVFYRERTGIPATRITTLPSTFGSALPPENLNSINNRGFELSLGTSGESRELKWDISGNISWSRAKWDHYEEPIYNDPDQERIYAQSGRWTDQQFGYLSDGLFTSLEEIKNLGYDQDNKGNTTLRPGDIKYLDVNGDKIIDWKDQVVIGKGTTPHWMIGLTTNLHYGNFDLSALFQGAMGYYNNIRVPGGILSAIYYEKRWTEENNDANAFFPRLGGSSSNSWTSDHFYRKANYLRLKTLTIGYNLPEMWLKKYNIKQIRIYAAGTNILTFSGLKKYNIDPESPSGMGGLYYPQQKTISLGINLSL